MASGFSSSWGAGKKSERSARLASKITETLNAELEQAAQDLEHAKQDGDQALAMDQKDKAGLGGARVAEQPRNKPAWLAATQH